MRLTDNSGEDEATGGDGTAVDTLASRRAILRGSCAGAASLCLLPTVAGLHTGQGTAASVAASGTVSFEDQTADSRDVVVALIETDIHVSYYLAAADGDTIFARGSLDPGRYEEYRIELQQPVTERREVELGLYALSIDQVVAIDTAVLSPVAGATFVDGLSVQLVERDPDAGFEYPYFLYAPTIRPEQRKPLLVHPNNSGESTDDFARHREAAREEATSGFPRRTADRLPAPLLVPVFPRPRDRPVDNTVYVQQLDRQTLTIDGGPLERVDRQLLAMAEDARARLQDAGYPIEDGLMLNGFSASGNFVERFAALHPAEVVSVTAGGVNGMPILPIERADGHDLDYHVGIAEIEALTGEPFDRDAFAEVHRFLYMGEHDVSDTIPYSDTFTLDRLRTAALDVYGRNMQRDRFPYAKAVYDQLGVNAVFREYAGAGHVTDPAAEDVATFHRRAVDGEPIEALRGDLGGGVPNLGAHVERSPAGPTVGETITFDGSRSTVEGTITEYVWHIDGERTTGVEVAHTFDQPGGHVVELAVAVEGGDTVRTVEQVVVTDPELTVSEPSVSVLNDETTANTIDLRIEAPEPVGYQVFVDERGGPDASGTVTPGVNELTVHLDMMLTRRQAIQVAIYPDGGGSALAEDRVTVEPGGDIDVVGGLGPRLIEADPDAGFEYPYFLYAPSTASVLPTRPLLVQPNNTGSPTDDFARHREAARKEVEANLGRRVADRLRAPLIVPVFPRPNEEPVDFTHLVHSLDRETLAIEDGPLERVDRQLLAMAEDARERLRDAEYPIGDGLLLNGFSASGTFVERFASLHPEEVVSVTAGGVNGMPLLPLAEADGHDLDYHVGVADVEALTGEPFDRDAFAEVNRFLYMGEFDDSDTLPFDDAFTLNRLRTAALDVYGPHMTDDRFPYSRAVYDELGANTVFRTYRGEAHTYRPAINDIVRYHARTIAGDDTAALRASLGGQTPNRRAQIVARPHRPIAGERVAFNASDSIAAGQQPTAYEWTFEDGTTATGKTTARTFGEPGTYAVTLRTTYPDATYEATDYVTVTSPPSGAEPAVGETTTAPADTATDRPDRTASARSTDASGPGFGVGVTATALFGAAELLRRLGDTDSDQ